MSIKTKPRVEVKPVAWTGDTVNKYQAHVSVEVEDRDKPVTFYGDPAVTEDGAVISLKRELACWQQALAPARDAVVKFKLKGDAE